MMKFNCEKCGQKLNVSESRAGKKSRCPRCKNIIVVPEKQATDPVKNQINSAVTDLGAKNFADNEILLEAIEKDKTQDEFFGFSRGPEKDTEYEQEPEEEPSDDTGGPPERKHPWFIDIFLYPICKPCLLTLGIIIIIPLLINIAVGLLGPFGLFVLVPGFFIDFVIGLYFLWYLSECIRDSAEGGIRAPETLANAPSLGELFSQLLRLLICMLIFAGPLGYYYIKTGKNDTIFWSLLALAVFFLPIGLLAVILFDSLRGLNPLLLIGSVFRTHFIYFALVVILWAVVLSVIFILKTLSSIWAIFLSGYFIMYILFIVAHLLGRFYWRYQEKLNWDF
jgi:DNA-directed RNA polymerase subunit RPC12/RpoP